MRNARVEYPTGRELLAAYWGYLSSGGLILDSERSDRQALVDGDPILLNVRITSLRTEYRLAGRVSRRFDGRAVVTFDAGEPQDVLLNAAWADGQGVPERRHRRWPVSLPVHFRSSEGEGEGLIVNVSRGGLCLEAETPLRMATMLNITGMGPAAGLVAEGRVRWPGRKPRRYFGVEFLRFRDDLLPHYALGDAQ